MASNNYNMPENDMLVPIYTNYVTNNPYFSLSTIGIDGIVYHDVGVGTTTKTAEQWQARWNRTECKNSVHAIVTIDKTCIMLPCFEKKGCAKKAAGCGKGSKGSFNNSRIQFESACSGQLVYSGASFTIKDKKKAIEEETKLRDNSIDFMARVCLYHGLDPLGKTKAGHPVIVDHRTAHLLGYGSGHADIYDKITGLSEVYPSLDFIRQKVKEHMDFIRTGGEIANMTQQEFDTYLSKASPTVIDNIMSAYFARRNKLPASKGWGEEAIGWAVSNGIMAGMGGDNMAPQGLVTREQCMAFLKRLDEKG